MFTILLQFFKYGIQRVSTGFYLLIFVVFAWKLKDVVDNFYIKTELRAVGMLYVVGMHEVFGVFCLSQGVLFISFEGLSCLPATIIWYLFNNVSSLRIVNKESFAVSTFALLMAATAAFAATTVI